MAIPFTIPNQEPSQPNIQELLRELCDILQQLLIFCRQQSVAGQPFIRNRGSTSNTANQDPIPELMTNLSLLSAAFNSQRVRRHRTSSESSCCEDAKNETSTSTGGSTTTTSVRSDWIEVDMDLRKIADFKLTGYKDDDTEEDRNASTKPASKQSSSSKGDSIFSKFVPAPFTGSICTAVICVVGWHLLRNR